MEDAYTIRYMTSLLTFYIKSEFSFTRNMILFKKPNTVLRFFPVGATQSSLPVTQLTSVSTSFRFNLGRFVLGWILAAVGIFMKVEGATPLQRLVIALAFLAVAAAMVIKAFETTLTIQATSYKDINISFFIFEKDKAYRIESLINRLISERLDDTNMTDQTDRLVDAIKSLKS